MQLVQPQQALSLIASVNPTLSSRLQSLELPKERRGTKKNRANLSFLQATYPFNSHVFHNGLALSPQEERLPPEFLGRHGLPLGLIITNNLEVIDRFIWQGKISEIASAILTPGTLIGLFEFIDYAIKSPVNRPDWTIVAGARTLSFAEIPRPGSKRGKLGALKTKHSQHHDIDEYEEDVQKTLSEWQLISALRVLREPVINWKAVVLFLSADWIELLASDIIRTQHTTTSMPGSDLLLADGWSKLIRAGDPRNSVYQALKGWGKTSNIRILEAAHFLLDAVRDVAEARRPCYVPTSYCGKCGPYADFEKHILKASGCHPCILEPAYLRKGESGYLSLGRVFPDLFKTNAHIQLNDIFNTISAARQGADDQHLFTPGLNYDELFPRLLFRRLSGHDKEGGMAKLFAAVPQMSAKRHRFRFEYKDQAHFYLPYFSERKKNDSLDAVRERSGESEAKIVPPTNSSFFRVAVKITR